MKHTRTHARIATGVLVLGLVGLITVMMVGYALAQRLSSGADDAASSIVVERDMNPAAVVSDHHLATEAGEEMLRQGGTAADAAVAIAAVLSVVEPWFSSVLGGGTWALYHEVDTGTVTSLNGVGPTGSKATVANYAARAGTPGMHQANVPGAWDGWMLWLLEYGVLDLDVVLEPAIRIAREGYEVSTTMQTWLDRGQSDMLGRPDTMRVYAPNGVFVRTGDTVHQHAMARTFEGLASAYREAPNRDAGIQAARDHYYRGPIAEAIVSFSDAHNGYLTLEDFAGFSADLVEPVSIRYDDAIEVFQNPPASQGITMLIALNILKGLDLSRYEQGSADVMHLQAESFKLAFADRHYHIGDPRRIAVPVEELLSEEYAERQRNRISMDRAMFWPIRDVLGTSDPALTNTTSFHVVDHEGNGAAVTTSLGAQFYIVGDTGIHINHRMRFHALAPGDPNQVAAGFTVRHTSNPYLAHRNGTLYLLGGNTGADSQPQAQAQQFISVVEFGATAQEAIDRPRFLTTAFPSTVYSYQVRNTLQLEEGYPRAVVDALRAKGHTVTQGEGTFGSANMIIRSEDGNEIETGAESRIPTSRGVVIEPSEDGTREANGTRGASSGGARSSGAEGAE